MANLGTNASKKKVAPKSRVVTSREKKTAQKSPKKSPPKLELPHQLLRQMHDLMVKARVLEERQIKIYKAGESYFWIGGPGEEAFGVPLGLLTQKGQGPEYDFLHLHYRCTPTLVAMGMPMIDAIRLMMNKATDPHTGGRNFSGHYCVPKWNVVPVTSPIETQYGAAIGTAHVQKRRETNGITIVTGGDAGTAEGDFASSLIWSARPGQELPMLITVQNNRWGISTNYSAQHGESQIADRGRAFNIKTAVMNGNDPIESYLVLSELMNYVRTQRKPVLLEAEVSRLYGHSSASGANATADNDCVREFEGKLLRHGIIQEAEVAQLWETYEAEGRRAQEKVRLEPNPTADSIWDHYFTDGESGDWRKF